MTETRDAVGGDVGRPGKSRSPSYPAVGLETCVGWARKMYESERKSATSALVVARHAGYNSLSGASRQALAAMKKFGLLVEEPGERLRLSEDAVRVVLQPDEGERLKILRALAIKPIIVHEILRDHSDGLPSDETLKFELIDGRKFSDDGAATFLKALHETIRFAKLSPGAYLTPMQALTPPSLIMDAVADQQDAARETAAVTASAARRRVPGENAPISVELSDGTSVTVQTTAALTADTFDELLDFLGVYKKILVKRARRDGVNQDPTE
jgi:hypothetical protein